jgi:hypothetical protein
MVDESKVNTIFRQSGVSCVLSSYGIVANYFTGRPVTDVFLAYCTHFGLPYHGWQNAEHLYANHFHAECRSRLCEGYKIILDLHHNSHVSPFPECRATFDARFILDSHAEVAELQQTQEICPAFLNVTYEVDGNYHTVTVFHNGANFRLRDTYSDVLTDIASIRSLGTLRDSIFYTKS